MSKLCKQSDGGLSLGELTAHLVKTFHVGNDLQTRMARSAADQIGTSRDRAVQ